MKRIMAERTYISFLSKNSTSSRGFFFFFQAGAVERDIIYCLSLSFYEHHPLSVTSSSQSHQEQSRHHVAPARALQ